MTTYNAAAVSDAAIAHKKGITLQQGRALRDNPLAVQEADASVPLGLLPTVLIATITTTSGTSQSATGLVLTPYKFLKLVFSSVSLAGSGTIQASGGVVATVGSGVESILGIVDICLATGGIARSVCGVPGGTITANVFGSGLTTASTTVTISASANFDNGSVLVYGCK